MSDQTAHVATADEKAIYKALSTGDNETVDTMREDAYNAEQVPDEDGVTPREQFDIDYFNAWTHYQADHEMPQDEREENTADQTQEENAFAAAAEKAAR